MMDLKRIYFKSYASPKVKTLTIWSWIVFAAIMLLIILMFNMNLRLPSAETPPSAEGDVVKEIMFDFAAGLGTVLAEGVLSFFLFVVILGNVIAVLEGCLHKNKTVAVVALVMGVLSMLIGAEFENEIFSAMTLAVVALDGVFLYLQTALNAEYKAFAQAPWLYSPDFATPAGVFCAVSPDGARPYQSSYSHANPIPKSYAPPQPPAEAAPQPVPEEPMKPIVPKTPEEPAPQQTPCMNPPPAQKHHSMIWYKILTKGLLPTLFFFGILMGIGGVLNFQKALAEGDGRMHVFMTIWSFTFGLFSILAFIFLKTRMKKVGVVMVYIAMFALSSFFVFPFGGLIGFLPNYYYFRQRMHQLQE